MEEIEAKFDRIGYLKPGETVEMTETISVGRHQLGGFLVYRRGELMATGNSIDAENQVKRMVRAEQGIIENADDAWAVAVQRADHPLGLWHRNVLYGIERNGGRLKLAHDSGPRSPVKQLEALGVIESKDGFTWRLAKRRASRRRPRPKASSRSARVAAA